MAFNPTPMQKKAIETRGNILVSAAAGSGKTAVLVERVINMLTDTNAPISADRLLVVTFTNAAAAEMRSRIEKRVYEEIQKNPENVNLQRQKYLLQNADICTIDSFCIKLVRENFEKCGVEPDFKISDGTQQLENCNRILSELIAECLENPSEDFYRLLELTGCEYDEKNLTELINRVYLYSQQLPFPQNFINGLSSPYEKAFTVGNAWYDMAFATANTHIDSALKCANKMVQVAPYTNKNCDKHMDYAQNITDMLENVKNIVALCDWDKLNEILATITFDRVPSSDKEDESAIVFKDNQKQIKSIIANLADLFCDSQKQTENNIKENLGAIKLFQNLITQYTNRVFESFKADNVFTFYNMEQLALNLLCEYKDGNIVIRDDAKELCNCYDEVLVDEFQDVNDLQDTLFNVLSNYEKNLFVVGDVKQSIYGFRGSNPDNFIKKKNRYTPIETANETESKKIILSDNFRSRKGVCDAVNFFFSCLMAGQCGSIVYNEDEQLNAGGTFPDSDAPTAEILVVDKYDDESSDSLLELEAKKIAEYIISVMKEGEVITDGKLLRKACYSDFVILLDKVKDKATVIANVLSSYGIPVSLGGDSFIESIEIATVMSLLQVIDNPKCDVELLATMMSPVFAFTAEEIAKIRTKLKYGPLYSAVVAYSKTGDKKTIDFIQKLTELRNQAAVLSVDRLISKIIHSTDILNIMSALNSGTVRRANLFALVNYAKSFVTRSDSGIYGFIKYLKSLPENSFKGVSVSGENGVTIMSMHNSKGLQFPVCIVANLSSQINNADSISRTLFSEAGGISFKYYSESLSYDTEMLGHALMANAAQIKTVEEKLRLLYVAMTRAIDRLCLVCSTKNLEQKLQKLSASMLDDEPYISREFLEKGRNMCDWILSCALLHPGGEVLRKYGGVRAHKMSYDSRLEVKLLNPYTTSIIIDKKEQQETKADHELAQKIVSNASYVYPYENLRFLQSKASVSRLVHASEDDRFDFCEKPAFMLGDRLSGARRGTAMHHIMQFINMTESVDVDAEIERLLEWKFITAQEAASVDINAIKQFFNSKLYSRIISANEVRREMRFLSEIAANRIDPTVESDAGIIVQGAVDLCFKENDGIIVLDFKTDRVDSLQQLVDCYGEQLEIYSTAAQKIFGLPVKEKIIYSFHLGESISF